MAVGTGVLPRLLPVSGIRIGVAEAGIKYEGRRDLVVFELAAGSHVAGVFTRNAFCAAPVTLAKAHLETGAPRYMLINTGNANAGTGEQGMKDAVATCQALADHVDAAVEKVLPFSTGVIGETLPVDKIIAAIPTACERLAEDNWEAAAHGILTTDTVPKGVTRQLEIEGRSITVTGIAKGSGMIRPDMATMLAYVATDAQVEQSVLQEVLARAVSHSFNRISVDGDTSTNDACMLVASGQSGVSITAASPAFEAFQQVISEVCEALAQAIVRDGEGATKLITVEVSGGRDEHECEQVAFTIAHSPLVKTAFFASDPNWGRILAAVGRAGVEQLDLNAVTIHLGDVCIVRDGGRSGDYREELGQAVMDQDEITVRVDLARGAAAVKVWTCDFSYDYVRINAEYRT